VENICKLKGTTKAMTIIHKKEDILAVVANNLGIISIFSFEEHGLVDLWAVAKIYFIGKVT